VVLQGATPNPPVTASVKSCRLIYTKASPLLCSKNKACLPISELIVKSFARALHNPTHCSWVKSVHWDLLPFDFTQPKSQSYGDDADEEGILEEPTIEEDLMGGAVMSVAAFEEDFFEGQLG